MSGGMHAVLVCLASRYIKKLIENHDLSSAFRGLDRLPAGLDPNWTRYHDHHGTFSRYIAGNPVVVGDGEPTLGGLAEIGANFVTLLACGIREVRGWMPSSRLRLIPGGQSR